MIWTCAALAVIILIILLTEIKLCIKLHIGPSFIELGLCFRLFFSLIPFTLRYRLEYEPFEGIRVMRYERRGGLSIIKILGEKKKKNTNPDKAVIRAVRCGMSVRAVEIAGEIGIPSDAFSCVLAAGILNILLDNAVRLALPLALDKKPPRHVIVNFFPCLSRPAFNLKLEGILCAIPLKLIKNTASAVLKKRKGVSKDNASNRKHHARFNGAN